MENAASQPVVPNRAQIRAGLRTYRVRRDASPPTKPSLAARRVQRRRQTRAARDARRRTRT